MPDHTEKPPTNQSLLPFHPLCAEFDLMEGAEFEELVGDIARRGLVVPITTFREPIPRPDGTISIYEMRTLIIDGRNRARACAKAGVTPWYEEFDGDAEDIPRFIISMNINRRHLKPERRRELLVKLLKLHPEKSDRALAVEAGVDRETVSRARKRTGGMPPVAKRTGRDGGTRRMPTKRVGEEPVSAAAALAALAVLKRGPALSASRPDIPTHEEELATTDKAREAEAIAVQLQDVGLDSAGEATRLQACIDELQCQKHQLELKITRLENEIATLKATGASIEQLLASLEPQITNKTARKHFRELKKALEELPPAIEGECVRLH